MGCGVLLQTISLAIIKVEKIRQTVFLGMFFFNIDGN